MKRRLVGLVLVLLLGGCAALRPLEPPKVSLQQIRWAPVEGQPGFEISLQVINPNRTPLPLQGVLYSLVVEELPLVEGSANALPTIAGYASAVVTLNARPNLLNGLRLLGRLAEAPPAALRYRLEATIDPGDWLPSQQIVEQGTLAWPGL